MNQDRYTAFLVRLLLKVKTFGTDAPYIKYYTTGEVAIMGTSLLNSCMDDCRYLKYPHLFPAAESLFNSLTTIGFTTKGVTDIASTNLRYQIMYQGKKVALVKPP